MLFLENYLEKEVLISDDHTSKEELCKILQVTQNCVYSENSNLREGEFFIVNHKCPLIYVVKPTDSLEGISKRFGKSVNEILEKNNIKTIFIGQQLYI